MNRKKINHKKKTIANNKLLLANPWELLENNVHERSTDCNAGIERRTLLKSVESRC